MERRSHETRPGSEYAERPAGAPETAPRGGEAAMASEEIDERMQTMLGALKREGRMGEPALAREAGVEIMEVNAMLVQLQQAGQVSRTSDGSWELTAAASSRTEPRPAPQEPKQEER